LQFCYVLVCTLSCVEIDECSPLLAKYFRTKKMSDDVYEEGKESQLVFEITSSDGFCIQARTCHGKTVSLYRSLMNQLNFLACTLSEVKFR